jgi:hypothetical protein
MRSSLKYALEKGKINKAIEIGVRDGKNALEIVQVVNELYLVDSYMPYQEITQQEQNTYKKDMLNRLAPFGDKIHIFNTTSELASTLFPDGFFDYIYIDSDHRYEAVKKDLECWYPKVNGIFAGHDFNKPHYGVKQAVTEFANKNNLQIITIKQDDDWQKNWEISDWWICKGTLKK